MRGLYAILDTTALEARSIPLVDAARAVAAAGVACLQVRAKDVGARRTLELLRAVGAVRGDVPLVANDRPDLAILAEASGVHVGQEDVPPSLARFLADERGRPLIVGLSTHDRDQMLAALDEPIDYVAIGPVLSTTSKANPDPVLGLDLALSLAREAHERRPGLPVCAIGGIGLEAATVLAAEFDLIAVIGALVADGAVTATDVGARARALVSAIDAARRPPRPTTSEATP